MTPAFPPPLRSAILDLSKNFNGSSVPEHRKAFSLYSEACLPSSVPSSFSIAPSHAFCRTVIH
jgi:hypothetical protein